jgi:hypothetical protein
MIARVVNEVDVIAADWKTGFEARFLPYGRYECAVFVVDIGAIEAGKCPTHADRDVCGLVRRRCDR